MIRHQSFSTVPTSDKGACAAIGNFDGVHLGHQSVIDLAREQAEALSAPLGIVTFEPHPRSFFAPDAAPFRLMNANAKAARLEKLGVEKLYEIPFNSDLSNLTAQEFVDQVLVWGLGVSHVVVGADFRFGKGRTGTAEMLKEAGALKGFGVTIVPLVQDDGGQFSSTAIQPRYGVYAVVVDIMSGAHQGRFFGAASMGVRPTFGVNHPNLESFLFDFSADIYGADISVALVDYIRPEEKFDDLDALIVQMDADCETARAILAKIA